MGNGKWQCVLEKVLRVIPVALFVALVGTLGVVLLTPLQVEGVVVDNEGRPLAGVVVRSGETELVTDDNGSFRFGEIRFGSLLAFERRGYRATVHVIGSGDWLGVTLEPVVLQGIVSDATTARPLGNARVAIGPAVENTDAAGKYRFSVVRGGSVVAEADGYRPSWVDYRGQSQINFSLDPNVVTIVARDSLTGALLSSVRVEIDGGVVEGPSQGEVTLERVPKGAVVEVSANGYSTRTVVYEDMERIEVSLLRTPFTGVVLDSSSGLPVVGARVSDGVKEVITRADGTFEFPEVSESDVLTVRANWFEKATIMVGSEPQAQVDLQPMQVRGLYLTYYGVGSDELRGNAIQLIEQTEANAVVIDVKGDRGWLAYRSSVPLVEQIGAQQQVMIDDPGELLRYLRERNIYSIARIVVFKDDPLARARPDLAVGDARTGGLWIDGEGLGWVDPFREEVWDYNIALAREAAELGFDEIQFDYIRFPTDPSAETSVDATSFVLPNTMENRLRAIEGFLSRADAALHPLGVAISVDVFGYVTWRGDDMGIGQNLESVAQYVDYVSPMVYPTLFWSGLPTESGTLYSGDAAAHPYEVVNLSMARAVERLGGPQKLRPWLQYYNDYTLDMVYGDREIGIQKQASYDAGIGGWMLWDPSNRYEKGGLAPE